MKNNKKYFFIGIGGISMSALAKILQQNGAIIAGSDINPNTKIEGIKIFYEHCGKNVENYDIIVYNSAIPIDNPEIITAKKLGKKIISRAELLAEISQKYKHVIAISGIHGKTTTTEMIAEVFLQANFSPTIHIGGISNCFNSNLYIGGKKYFITEACEYKDSFLTLNPELSVILNIEPEHLDYFQTFENIKSSFQKFANQSNNIIKKGNFFEKNTILIGKNGFFAKNIEKTEFGYTFDVFKKNKLYQKIKLNAIGLHNIENSLFCIAVCDFYGISKKHIFTALKNYKGVQRRMQLLNQNPIIIHDYAHHPTEISSVIDAVKNHYKKDVYVVFQPHTYSRTKSFFGDFKKSLNKSSKLFIIKTYSAREKEIFGATAHNLYEAIKKNKKDVFYFDDFPKAEKQIKKELKQNCVLLFLGAGDIDILAHKFKK